MQKFRVWWNSFKTVALLISFTTNMVFLIVLLLLLMQIFQIKNGVVEPLVDGLHRNFVGLDEAVIIRSIEVNDEIPVQFDLPLNQVTNVVLTQDVPLAANATFTLPGGGGMINGRVDLVLPRDLILPVQLNLTVPVDTRIPINLPVALRQPAETPGAIRPGAGQSAPGLARYAGLRDRCPARERKKSCCPFRRQRESLARPSRRRTGRTGRE